MSQSVSDVYALVDEVLDVMDSKLKDSQVSGCMAYLLLRQKCDHQLELICREGE